MKYIFLSVILVVAQISEAQNLKTIEDNLLIQYKKIVYWSNYRMKEDEKISVLDSLFSANSTFEQMLLNYTSQYPSTIKYNFQVLKDEGISVASSKDGFFRIYSWDTWEGGTMHMFRNVYQYKVGEKVLSKVIKDTTIEGGMPGSWYSSIYTLKAGKKTIYIGINHSTYSTMDHADRVKLFSIENENLNDTVHLIKTKTGIRNELGYNYNLFSNDKNRTIYFDAKANAINIPVVSVNGKMTDKYIIYKFKGIYFEKE